MFAVLALFFLLLNGLIGLIVSMLVTLAGFVDHLLVVTPLVHVTMLRGLVLCLSLVLI